MLPTRVFFILLVLVNTVINGLALAADVGAWVSDRPVIAAALAFNLLVLPVAVFAAYRMGGMTEEIYRERAEQEVARAGTAASRQAEAARKTSAQGRLDAQQKQGDAARPPGDG